MAGQLSLRGHPRHCYLMIHDRIKQLLPSAKISAYFTAPHEFQCDMVVGAPDYKNTRGYIYDFANKLQQSFSAVSIVLRKRRLDVTFHSNHCTLLVGVGPEPVSTAQLNSCSTWEEREPLRASLGSDEELFMQSPLFREYEEVIEVTCSEHDSRTGPLARLHPMVWRCVAYKMIAASKAVKHDSQMPPILLKANLRAFLCQNYGVAPCENPFCPGENLHTLRSLQSIAEFSMPNGKYLTENIKRGYPVEWVFIEH